MAIFARKQNNKFFSINNEVKIKENYGRKEEQARQTAAKQYNISIYIFAACMLAAEFIA